MSKPNSKPWTPWHLRLHKQLLWNKNLLPSGASLLLAVSGGQDSMALLKLLLDLQRLYKWKLHVWHGNHGWHKQSTQTAKELERWCKERNLNFTCEESTKTKLKTEEAARDWRYSNLVRLAQLLSKESKSQTINYVLTAHTSTDRAETMLLHLARGAHLGGLGSLRRIRTLKEHINLVRPLLPFSREDTAQICKEMNLPIWIDPSNSSLAFSRNRVRKEILPVLESLHPGSSKRIASVAEKLSHLKEDQTILAKLAIEAVQHSKGLSRQKIIQLPINTRATIFAQWLTEVGAPFLGAAQLEEISHRTSARMPPGQHDLAKGWKVQWDRESIHVVIPKN